jgi:hypothetical protein
MSEEIVEKKNTKFNLIKNILFILVGVLLLCFVGFSGNLSKSVIIEDQEMEQMSNVGNGQ